MSENDVRDGLREAVAGEPPLDFDADALVDTARRQVRRRALLSVGAATVAVVAVAVAVPIALNDTGGTAPVAGRPAVTSPTAEPTQPDIEWPPPGVAPVEYTAAQLRERATAMHAHLEAVLPTLLPHATDVKVAPFGGEAEGAIADGQNYLNAFATFAIDGARYGISVNVHAPGASRPLSDLCEQHACIDLRPVAGGHVVSTADLGDGMKILSVHHLRNSGAEVFVSGYNYDPTSETPSTYHPTIPVDADLLAELATDPQLDL